MRILFLGSGEFAVPTLGALANEYRERIRERGKMISQAVAAQRVEEILTVAGAMERRGASQSMQRERMR